MDPGEDPLPGATPMGKGHGDRCVYLGAERTSVLRSTWRKACQAWTPVWSQCGRVTWLIPTPLRPAKALSLESQGEAAERGRARKDHKWGVLPQAHRPQRCKDQGKRESVGPARERNEAGAARPEAETWRAPCPGSQRCWRPSTRTTSPRPAWATEGDPGSK